MNDLKIYTLIYKYRDLLKSETPEIEKKSKEALDGIQNNKDYKLSLVFFQFIFISGKLNEKEKIEIEEIKTELLELINDELFKQTAK